MVLTARDISRIESLAAVAPEQALAVALDVTKEDQIQAALEAAIARFGPLDVVVNNAGYGLIGAIEECQPEQIRRCVETNFFGTLNVIRAVLPHLRTQRSGHIVNISAAAAISNYAGFGVYGAAKAAVEALSESLRAETAPSASGSPSWNPALSAPTSSGVPWSRFPNACPTMTGLLVNSPNS